jgi:membrane associated rhomboid family serine protease
MRPTVVTYALVAINILVFAAERILFRSNEQLHERLFGELLFDPQRLRVWMPITYAFLHGGLLHLLGNMVFLWVFGPNVEDRFGRIGFLLFYLLGGIAAALIHAAVYQQPMVGASGAIAAVTGAYLVLFPHTTIRTLLFFFLIGIFHIPAWWFIGARIIWDLFAEALRVSGNVATLAHLGGYGFGIGVSMLLLWTGLLRREPYDLFTISKQARRRRHFRELNDQRNRHAQRGQNPDQATRPGRLKEATAEAIASARAEVATRMAEENLPAAAAAYRQLLERHAAMPGATLLNRRLQYDIANVLFKLGEHQTAAIAYEQFLKGYPTDPEVHNVRLILGLINARYLNDPVRAKQEIAAALEGLGPGPQEDLARELLAELG